MAIDTNRPRRPGCASRSAKNAPSLSSAAAICQASIRFANRQHTPHHFESHPATNTFAQPGRATGHMYTALTCPAVGAAATSDGLHACPNFAGTLGAGHGWYVALVIWPGVDYHWYRQDKVGCWSHKPGSTAARNTDNSGSAITDPRTCNRGSYTNFCTYMITTRHVRIR